MSDRLTALIASLDQKSVAALRELAHLRKQLKLLESENEALKAQLEERRAAAPATAGEDAVVEDALNSPGNRAEVEPPHSSAVSAALEPEGDLQSHDETPGGTGELLAESLEHEGTAANPAQSSSSAPATPEVAAEAAEPAATSAQSHPPSDQQPSPQALLKQWYSRYPNAFFTAHTKPLKIGIHEELIARESWPPRLVRRALANYVNLPRYLKSVRVGVQRIDLDGQPAGEIVEQDVQHARQQLEALQQRRREREEKQSAERMSRKLAQLNARLGH